MTDGVDPIRPPGWMRALPRRAMSRVLGTIGDMPVPGFVLRPVLKLYCKHYGVNMMESTHPITSFPTFRAFFSRAIKPDARTIAQSEHAIVSPSDGTCAQIGSIRDGTLVQAKGLTYRVDALLGSRRYAEQFDGGAYMVIYLAPGDYHRFHWPVDGTLTSAWHLPGDLWPVNPSAVSSVKNLFAVNERVVLSLATATGTQVAMVPVGALNVGSIRIDGVALRTNTGAPAGRRLVHPAPTADPGAHLAGARGDLMGWFGFGSSIVLLIDRATLREHGGSLTSLEPGTTLQMGQRIGQLRPA